MTRGALGDGETGGLDGPGLRKCLERLAVAAYATVPTMGVGDKVEALFLHMGLAEKLIEATRAAPRRARSAPRADEENPAALPPVVQPGGRPQIAPRPDVVDASAAVAPTRIRGSGDYYYPGGDVADLDFMCHVLDDAVADARAIASPTPSTTPTPTTPTTPATPTTPTSTSP